jgi:hypothetical protein
MSIISRVRVGSREDIRERIAIALHKSFEKRDPSPDGDMWEGLPENCRELYRGCVMDVLYELDAIGIDVSQIL